MWENRFRDVNKTKWKLKKHEERETPKIFEIPYIVKNLMELLLSRFWSSTVTRWICQKSLAFGGHLKAFGHQHIDDYFILHQSVICGSTIENHEVATVSPKHPESCLTSSSNIWIRTVHLLSELPFPFSWRDHFLTSGLMWIVRKISACSANTKISIVMVKRLIVQ